MQKRLSIARLIALFMGLALFSQSAFAQTGKAISALPDGGPGISTRDSIPIVQGGTTKRATLGQILELTGAVTSDAYSDFASAHTAAVAAGKALLLTTNLDLTGDITTTVPIHAVPGVGTITQTGAYVLNLAGGFSAGNEQVFVGFSQSQVAGLSEANIRWWGAKQDSSTDSASAIRAAVYAAPYTHVLDDGSGNYYRVLSAVELPSRFRISSKGFPQIYNDSAAAEPIFTITGTEGARKTDVIIESLNLRNGTSSTGDFTNGKDVIKVTYADDVTVINCKLPDTQGAYAIRHDHTRGFRVMHTKIPKWTYAAIASLIEVEDTLLYDLDIGTPMSRHYAQVYATMTGGEALGVGDFGVRGYRQFYNRFNFDNTLNFSRWHAVNSHGGEDITLSHLDIKNYRAGINVALVAGYWSNPILRNVSISHIDIDRGTATFTVTAWATGTAYTEGDAVSYSGVNYRCLESHSSGTWATDYAAGYWQTVNVANGILVYGQDWNSDGNYLVEWCKIKGMGQASPVSAAMNLGYGYGIKAYDNEIEDWDTVGLYLQKAINGGEFLRTRIKNHTGSSTTSYAVYANTPGLYGVLIDHTRIWATDRNYIPTYGLYKSAYYSGNVIIGDKNDVQASSTAVSSGTMNWGYSAVPTGLYWKHGDPVFTAYGSGNKLYTTESASYNGYYGWFKPATTAWITATSYAAGERVIESSTQYVCLIAHTSGTFADDLAAGRWALLNVVTGTAGQYTVTLAGGTYNYHDVPPGAHVVITNGAAGPSSLTTQVLHSSISGVLTLKDPLGASVSNQPITMVPATFRGVGTITASTTWDPASIATGSGLTSSGITVTGAALGDGCEVSYSGDLQDLIKSCYVQSTNTVEIRLFNSTASSVDLASGTWRIWVSKY